jgi:hypothetical protein
MPHRSIENVHQSVTEDWMKTPGVAGTAIGLLDGRPCIKVYVVERTPELVARIPESVDGYPVVMEVTGEFRAPPVHKTAPE